MGRAAPIVEAGAGLLEANAPHVRRAARGGQHPLDAGLAPVPAQARTVAIRPAPLDLRAEMQGEGLREDLPRHRLEVRIAQAAEAVAGIEDLRLDAEPGHGLREFEPDRAGAEHGERGGQVLHVEHGVGGQQTVPEILQRIGHARAGACRQHGGLEAQAGVVVDPQPVRALEHGPARQARRCRQSVEPLEHGGHEAVAPVPHPGEHGGTVHGDLAADADAEAVRLTRAVSGVRGGDQQLGGHAAHPRAGGAAGTLLDQDRLHPRVEGGPVGGYAGGAGPDHRDVAGEFAHQDAMVRTAPPSTRRFSPVM